MTGPRFPGAEGQPVPCAHCKTPVVLLVTGKGTGVPMGVTLGGNPLCVPCFEAFYSFAAHMRAIGVGLKAGMP